MSNFNRFSFLQLVILFGFLLFSQDSNSQNILESEPYSRHAYIYKISADQAKTFFENEKPDYNSAYFQILVDSFPAKSEYRKNLNQGYYLKVEIEKNQVKTSLTAVQHFNVFIHNNDKDLNLKVLGLDGKPIKSAQVRLKRKTLKFDDKTNTYSLSKTYKSGLLSVTQDGHTFYYILDKSDNRSFLKRKLISVAYGTPVKYVWKPVKFIIDIPIDGYKSISRGWGTVGAIDQIKNFAVNLYEDTACLFDEYYCDDPITYGYAITDKPKYRPGDKINLKAFLLNKRYKGITKDLNVVLYESYQKKKKLGTIKPYADGGYTFSFQLHDSLDMKLDKRYALRLTDDKNLDYETAYFYFEDYTLKGNTVEVTSETETQFKGDSLAFFISARDENELNLMDARAEILVKPRGNFKAFHDKIFIPDTLWKVERPLDPKSKTEVNIPHDIFPKANIDYTVQIDVKTADNEVTRVEKNFSYVYKTADIQSRLVKDSLHFFYTENGKENPKSAKLYIEDYFENIDSLTTIELPYKLKINPYNYAYEVVTDSLKKRVKLDDYSENISVNTRRTKDSVFVEVSNMRDLELLYHTYKLNKQIDEGKSSKGLSLKYATNSKQNYYFSLSYLWAGQVVHKNYELKTNTSQLLLDVKQPPLIYPGKTDTILIKVTDYNKQPVKDVDITAYGLTKKFNFKSTSLPDLQKYRKRKTIINNFSFQDKGFNQNQYDLNIKEWEEKARLDSIIYYDFMYPKDVFLTTVETEEEICQFAPFVMEDGLQKEVKVIYVDGNPIYTAWNEHYQNYSFKIKPGFHNIKLRTRLKEYTIDSLYFVDLRKTIFSIDAKTESAKVKSKYLGYELTLNEKLQLYPRIMRYDEHDVDFLAYLKSKDRYFILDKGYNRNKNHKNLITGPVYGEFEFMTYDSLYYKQPHESGYTYTFLPKYLRLKSFNEYPEKFSYQNDVKSLNDKVLTKDLIQNVWQQKILNRRRNIPYKPYPNSTSKDKATLQLIDKKPNPDKVVINTIIVNSVDGEDLRLYAGFQDKFFDLSTNIYRVIFLFQDKTYQVLDNITLKPDGLNVLSFTQPEHYLKDFMSSAFNEIINKAQTDLHNQKAYEKHLRRLKESYQKREEYFGPGNYVSGVVMDESGLPIPGVNVFVKGTTIGTQTDFDGVYTIKVPTGSSKLVYNYVGMHELQKNVWEAENVMLEANTEALEEVVMIGSLTSRSIRRNKTADLYLPNRLILERPSPDMLQSLNGQVAGLNIVANTGQSGGNAIVQIRGVSSVSPSNSPLFVVNGIPLTEEQFTELSSDDIEAITVLKDASATSIYGARGVNGVVLITTKFGSNPIQGNSEMNLDSDFYAQNALASSIRNNFSDVAYWQPQLRTDENGEASFVVTYPDDITSWQTIVLAMNENRQTGSYQSFVKAYKPVSARLYTPKFLIEGDEAKAIGKSLNYTQDTLDITTALEFNGKQVFRKDKASSNAKIDTLNITAKGDTLQLTYKLQQKNSDYFDGEKRSIPVFRKGVEVKEGAFRILMPGDTLNYKTKAEQGQVEVYAEADALNLIETDLNYVINYRYDCNEQLASKLTMLLAKQKIYKHLKKPFEDEKQIKKIIKTLQKNRNDEQLWGWWKFSKETNYWISQHVVKALLKAHEEYYNTDIDQESLSIYLKNEFYKDISTNKKIEILSTLSLLKNKPVLSLNDELKSIFNDKDSDLNQKLRLSLIAEQFNLEPSIEFLDDYQGEDMLGTMYFDYDNSKSYWISNNRIRNTILAYQLIRKVNPKDERLPQILMYLLNAKTEGRYVNTYQATNIMETILPDVLKDSTGKPEAKITINNSTQEKFPFKTTYTDKDVSITNTGNIPVYVIAYQHYFKTEPELLTSDFEIKSSFIEKPDNSIKNGEEVTLKVVLNVKKEAEYTMLNIPIPGGFDYTSKPVNYGLEDHREYFKHETSIFCSQLKEGQYTFEIPLVAKYSGTYNLNPAKVELMYFPTFHAHEGLKVIRVK